MSRSRLIDYINDHNAAKFGDIDVATILNDEPTVEPTVDEIAEDIVSSDDK